MFLALHPLNLGLRFLLELAALVALAYWGWQTHSGLPAILYSVGLPVAAGALWGLLRVPGDASASGSARIPVTGWLRLALEWSLFGGAVAALAAASVPMAAWGLAVAAVGHYGLSLDRVLWLLGPGERPIHHR